MTLVILRAHIPSLYGHTISPTLSVGQYISQSTEIQALKQGGSTTENRNPLNNAMNIRGIKGVEFIHPFLIPIPTYIPTYGVGRYSSKVTKSPELEIRGSETSPTLPSTSRFSPISPTTPRSCHGIRCSIRSIRRRLSSSRHCPGANLE